MKPILITRALTPVHQHTYGGESRFFAGLAEGELWATRCDNPACEVAGLAGHVFCPPRVYCPDCLAPMTWVSITEQAKKTAKIHSFVEMRYPGAFNTLPVPTVILAVEIEGMTTTLMGRLREGTPTIGMAIEPVFETESPSFTILDLSWRARS